MKCGDFTFRMCLYSHKYVRVCVCVCMCIKYLRNFALFLLLICFRHGEGNGNPLHYSCLEKPVDRGTWQAMVHRVTENQTQLKLLSMHISDNSI